jgi:HEAT repeat protein
MTESDDGGVPVGVERVFEDLLAKLQATDPNVVSAAARGLGDLKDSRSVLPLLALLQETDVPIVRNAAAMALREIGDERAVPVLASLLNDPKTAGYRGTLVYALRGFDCAPLLPLLVDLVITGGFEVSRQALQAIESIQSEIPLEIWTPCLRKIHDALPKAKGDNADVLQELRDLFEKQ